MDIGKIFNVVFLDEYYYYLEKWYYMIEKL